MEKDEREAYVKKLEETSTWHLAFILTLMEKADVLEFIAVQNRYREMKADIGAERAIEELTKGQIAR